MVNTKIITTKNILLTARKDCGEGKLRLRYISTGHTTHFDINSGQLFNRLSWPSVSNMVKDGGRDRH